MWPLVCIWSLLLGPALAWASEDEEVGFGLISGILLLILLFSTAWAGFAMLRGRATRRRHHLLAYSTLFLALLHAVYNLFFH